MVKSILLKLDEKVFFKLKEYKAIMEKKFKKSMSWEEYIEYLFKSKDNLI